MKERINNNTKNKNIKDFSAIVETPKRNCSERFAKKEIDSSIVSKYNYLEECFKNIIEKGSDR